MLKFLYFKNLKYSKQSIKLIKKKFKLIEKNFPTKTIQEQIKDTVVLSAPLGFNFDETFLSKFKNLKVIVSNTTSIPHIDEEYCKNKKIYISALHNDKTFLKNISADPNECFALEDSRLGLLSSKAAKIPTIVCPSVYNQNDDFSEADYVVESFNYDCLPIDLRNKLFS